MGLQMAPIFKPHQYQLSTQHIISSYQLNIDFSVWVLVVRLHSKLEEKPRRTLETVYKNMVAFVF